MTVHDVQAGCYVEGLGYCRNRGGSLYDAEDAAAVLHQLRVEPAHGRHHRVHLNKTRMPHAVSAHTSSQYTLVSTSPTPHVVEVTE